MSKQGILLINLGTPDDCNAKAVYFYLKEFLNDPRVIDLPKLLRWILVNFIIIPFRYKKTAALYQKIWKSGSPLLIYSNELKKDLAIKLGNHYQVELGMRYGKPSIKEALHHLRHCKEITVIPLFPQYSSAATGSANEVVLQYLSKQWNIPKITMVRDFYNNNGFIDAYAHIIQSHLQNKSFDFLLFSYHGLPERHIHKSNCIALCDRKNACPAVDTQSQFCYRAQCYETSTLITQKLKLSNHQVGTAFQSRLGKTPWIKPYTDLLLPELIAKGVRNLAVVCPSFTADCLETLEEVNIRAREQWQKLGGHEFHFIPCLNSHPLWVDALTSMIKEK